MAQEILSTFSEEAGAVTLVPGTGGIFTIVCDGQLVWDRKTDGGFPEAKVLKQRLRDRLWRRRTSATATARTGKTRPDALK